MPLALVCFLFRAKFGLWNTFFHRALVLNIVTLVVTETGSIGWRFLTSVAFSRSASWTRCFDYEFENCLMIVVQYHKMFIKTAVLEGVFTVKTLSMSLSNK